MERLQQAVARLTDCLACPRTLLRGQAALLPLTLLLVLGAGCSLEKEWLKYTSDDTPPTGDVIRVASWWQTQVAYAPDPLHGGQMTPGMAGRVYLFGDGRDSAFPLKGDGGLIVDLFNDSVPGSPPVLMEEWRFDKDTLQRFLRKDMIGWGYTLFLPWLSYRQDITHIQMKVCFDRKAEKGGPLFTENQQVTLNPSADVHIAHNSTLLGATANPAPAAPTPAPANPAPSAPPAVAAAAPPSSGMVPGGCYSVTVPGQRLPTIYPAGGNGVTPVAGYQNYASGVVPAAVPAGLPNNGMANVPAAAQPNIIPIRQSAPVFQDNSFPVISSVGYGTVNTGMTPPAASESNDQGAAPPAAGPALDAPAPSSGVRVLYSSNGMRQ
jgi:hypothetical protein